MGEKLRDLQRGAGPKGKQGRLLVFFQSRACRGAGGLGAGEHHATQGYSNSTGRRSFSTTEEGRGVGTAGIGGALSGLGKMHRAGRGASGRSHALPAHAGPAPGLKLGGIIAVVLHTSRAGGCRYCEYFSTPRIRQVLFNPHAGRSSNPFPLLREEGRHGHAPHYLPQRQPSQNGSWALPLSPAESLACMPRPACALRSPRGSQRWP